MFSLTKRIGVAALAGVAVVGFAARPASAQSPFYQVRPGLSLAQYTYNLAAMGQGLSQVPPWAFGFNPYPRPIVPGGGYGNSNPLNPYANPYLATAALATNMYGTNPGTDASLYSSSPYSSSLYANPYDPFSGYLRGSADVINAQGKFMVNQQQAFIMNEQYRQERLKSRRAAFEEYLYEREHTPTAQDDYERLQTVQLRRARNNPPVTDILSARSLNDLLADLRKHPAKTDEATMRTYPLPLDEENLRHINVAATRGGGNIGLLKNNGKLSWPVALSGPELKEERERITSLVQEAVEQAQYNNRVDPGIIRQIAGDASVMRRELRQNIGDLPPATYIEATTFLNNLDDASRALQQKDVGSYFGKDAKYALRAKSIPELVKFMVDNGLQFAPAVSGDEGAYQALYQALLNYDVAGRQQVVEK